MRKVLHRYIFREILVPFAFGLSVFTGILLIARLLRLIELVVTRGVPALNILRLLGYIMPAFLEVTVPMAMLLSILVAFGRLSADSEMIAMRSSGLSLYQLVRPVAIFVVLATLATAALSIWARPWGNRALKSALFDIARTRASAGNVSVATTSSASRLPPDFTTNGSANGRPPSPLTFAVPTSIATSANSAGVTQLAAAMVCSITSRLQLENVAKPLIAGAMM